jgi:ubiquinone/menaquinone biosynthesis C-methylase UbiE
MSTTVDYAPIKQKQQAAWASGDYAVIGTTLQLVGEQLAEACDLRYGAEVIDVAAGNGNATLAAARRGAIVTSTDYVPELLARGEARAKAEGLVATFEVADAEALPYPDARFDAALSTFGVMFAPDQATAAKELARVVRSGGQIGLANWTPDSLIGKMFVVLGGYLPPSGLEPPSRWGNEEYLEQLFDGDAAAIDVTRRTFAFRYASAAHFIETFRTWYGPVHKAFGALADEAKAALEQDLHDLLTSLNRGTESLTIPSEYLEVVITRR